MDKLILANGNTINLDTGASLEDIRVAAPDRDAMLQAWQQLTPDNLADIQIQNSDGATVGHYKDLLLVSETSTVAADGTVLTSYRLRPKTEVDRLTDRVAAVEETTDILAMDALTGGETA